MNAISPPKHPFPKSMCELSEGEHLIVWSFRRWIAGHADRNANHWLLVWNNLARKLGTEAGRDALGGLEAVVRAIWNNARRQVRYHRPCCAILGPDEYRVVALIGACQAGEWSAARLLAEWLVGDNGVGDLLGAGSRLARAMKKSGHDLPVRHLSGTIEDTSRFRPVGEQGWCLVPVLGPKD